MLISFHSISHRSQGYNFSYPPSLKRKASTQPIKNINKILMIINFQNGNQQFELDRFNEVKSRRTGRQLSLQ